jgi:PPM family protein phosphatase
VQLTVHVATRRSRTHLENQDRAVVGASVVTTTAGIERREVHSPTILAVLDGLGGHAAGEVASDLVAQLLAVAEPPATAEAIDRLVQRADHVVHEAAARHAGRHGMGTTLAMLSLGPEGGTVANVGDSSVWWLDDGALIELSVPDRVNGGILQCLGGHTGSPVTPHVREVDLHPGDRLLLASDGLTDVVTTESIAALLRGDADYAAERLLSTVAAAGPPDDFTIVIADVTDVVSPPRSRPLRARRRG